MSVGPSVCTQQLGSHWTDFYGNPSLSIFRKSVKKFQVSLQSDNNTVRLLYMNPKVHFWSHLAQFFLQWEMFQTKAVQKIKTHILCSVTSFDNRAVCGYCRVGQATDGNIMQRMRIACWIAKATSTHLEYVILIVHCKNCCTSAPQCYAVGTAPLFLIPSFYSRFPSTFRHSCTACHSFPYSSALLSTVQEWHMSRCSVCPQIATD